MEQPSLLDAIHEARADVDGAARKYGHDTEHDAGARVGVRSGETRWAALAALYAAGNDGLTDYELAIALDVLRTSAGKRRHELACIELVVDSGQRRETDTGTTAIVWRITDHGALVFNAGDPNAVHHLNRKESA